MMVVNNSERPIVIGKELFVPTEPKELSEELLQHPRVKELMRLRDLAEVVEVEEVT